MEAQMHDMAALFDQLGLPSEPAAIDGFIATHGPLPAAVQLCEAPFWSAGQADFLRESTLEDSDWAEVVDLLDESLRGQGR